MQDTMGDAVLNDKLGIGITYFDEKHRAKFDSLQKMVASDATRQASLAERNAKAICCPNASRAAAFHCGCGR